MSTSSEIIRKCSICTSLWEALDSLQRGQAVCVRGLAGSLQAFVFSLLAEDLRRQILTVVDEDEIQEIADDLSLLTGADNVQLFHTSHRRRDPTAAQNLENAQALHALVHTQPKIIVTTPLALTSPVPPPDIVRQEALVIERGNRYAYEQVISRLASFGFVKQQYVQSVGEYAVRGGILDVYPFVGDNPLRIEFDGDVVESVREFDPLSQRSIRELSAARIVPDLFSLTTSSESILLDYIRSDAFIVLQEPMLDASYEPAQTHEASQSTIRWVDLLKRCESFAQVHIRDTRVKDEPVFDFHATPQPAVNSSMKVLRAHVAELQARGYRVVIAGDTDAELQRLKDLLAELEPLAEDEELRANAPLHIVDVGSIDFTLDSLHRGFVFPDARLALFTEHQIFNRLKRRGKTRRATSRGLTRKDILDLRKGDFVVHTDFGIGQFEGLHTITIGNVEHEVLKLRYEEKDTVYVNLNYLHKVQKYSSRDGHVPKLTRLGSGEWDRMKARAKKRVKDIARDLITLYAKRKALPGFSFARDTLWQRELEASFIYDDTPDQARATEEVKQDMESPHPMDRLICGDVGFGKTEVAVRAAFKAVMSGKQVALLVPTTILAMQHYQTFRDRLSRYTTHIEVLSRFRTPKEQKAILQHLQTGTVDIIIGTHRLLSKDVHFKDLGLLIIDEEHRFGVAAKEKLRQLKATVDTLTLTATPIPRTLHFSLLGARDLSIIATPPQNRLPVITEIVQYDDDLIRDAILREIHRGGQVFFVHDRVQTIDHVTSRLHQAMPGVRFCKAHGQMRAHELEEVMLHFLERRYDVLVATKIIESGIDIPNVNTIIINRADRFGMAELYQLRGRVGRSNIQAYAYLVVPPLSSLPRETVRRLQALEEFTELGSGFNLAMRDLEIRGAGNLLGGEQSGFIDALGFEMYTRILEEAVAELKEKEFSDLFGSQQLHRQEQTAVEADMDVHIPDWYIEDGDERLAIYRRLYGVTDISEVDEIAAELKDRFGARPVEVERLLSLVRLRRKATLLGFPKIMLSANAVTIEFPPQSDSRFYESETFQLLMANISRMRQASLRQNGDTLTLVAPLARFERKDPFEAAHALIDELLASVAPATPRLPALAAEQS